MKEEIICEYRPGIKKASIIFPYWTDITYSGDPGVWKRDLEEHRSENLSKEELGKFINLNINDDYGGFGFDINSLEELDELSRFFWDYGFHNQLNDAPRDEYSQKERVWFDVEGKTDKPLIFWGCHLYLYPLKWTDYYKLREVLLELWKIGYLVSYKNFKYY